MSDLSVSRQNYDVLRRLDEDHDGSITAAEAKHAIEHAGIKSELQGQLAALAPEDRAAVEKLVKQDGAPVQLSFEGKAMGTGRSWSFVERRLQETAATLPSTPATRGQGRMNNLEGDDENYDCGQTVGQFLHTRRLEANGQTVPAMTHAEADAVIAQDTKGAEGTSSSAMQGILQKRYATAGSAHYTFHRDMFTNADQMEAALRRGLATDPAGVMVPINYKRTDTSDPGPHWIAVTSIEPNGTVHYFDPGGIDGANHERTMSLSDLRAHAIYDLPQIGVVYGSKDSPSQPAHLAKGAKLAELEVRLSNRDITVTDYVGSFPSQAIAEEQAKIIAARDSMDAVVVKEGDRYTVYGTTEIRKQFGGLWSDNTLTNVNSNVVGAFMTDPQTKKVRAAHLPGK